MTEPNSDLPPIEEVSLRELYELLGEAEREAGASAKFLLQIKEEFTRRFEAQVKAAFEAAGKQHGTVTLDLGENLTGKADIRRTVSWDTAALMRVAQSLPWERASKLFKIEFTMPEANFKALENIDPPLAEIVAKARVTKYSRPSLLVSDATAVE